MRCEQLCVGDPSIVDLQAVSERVGGDTELILEIVQIFFDCYPEAMARVREAIVLGDAKSLESAAHSLRGYLVSFHAKRASEAALELELSGRSGRIERAGESLARLQREIDLVMPLLASLEEKSQ